MKLWSAGAEGGAFVEVQREHMTGRDTTLLIPEFYGRNMAAWVDCLTYGTRRTVIRDVVIVTTAPGGA